MNLTHLSSPTNPVQQAYAGGDQINVRQLGEFCNSTTSNIQTLVNEINKDRTVRHMQYEASLKFLNWLATTNPKVLDEFKAVATTLEQLEPRDDGGEATAYASP